MRKILMFNMVSADGYFARTNGDIDWHVVDAAFNKYAIELLASVDTILFGRITYQLFERFWPGALQDPTTGADDRLIAKAIDDAQKIVFSTSLKEVSWRNSKLKNIILKDDIQALKDRPGKNIVIYGSGSVVQELTSLGLIDEYNLMVNPVILGNGKPMFKDVKESKLALLGADTFESGNVLLRYKGVR